MTGFSVSYAQSLDELAGDRDHAIFEDFSKIIRSRILSEIRILARDVSSVVKGLRSIHRLCMHKRATKKSDHLYFMEKQNDFHVV